ncbi:MAG: zf-HC2 domain-containing protein [Clostridium sp.]|nr:zf-HC2 domain-containing protein [Clostridium sp.]
MTDITCNTCMDLIPLVKDSIASDDSRLLVKEHINGCKDCALVWNEEVQLDTNIDAKVVTNKIKKQLQLIVVLIIALSTLFGIGLATSQNMFFNILLMPTIGTVSYIFLKNKAFFVALFVLMAAYLWHFIIIYAEHRVLAVGGLIASLWWGVIYAGLCVVGIVVAFLLHFAFKKEVSK